MDSSEYVMIDTTKSRAQDNEFRQRQKWRQHFLESKPLVSHAVLIGPDITDIAKLFLDIMIDRSILGKDLKSLYLDCMPRETRKVNLPERINDFIFYDGYQVMCSVEPEMMPKVRHSLISSKLSRLSHSWRLVKRTKRDMDKE